MAIIPSMGRGGAERVMARLTQEWCRAHDVTLVTFSPDSSQDSYATPARRIFLGLPARSTLIGKLINLLMRAARLRKLIRQEKPDATIAFLEGASFAAILTGQPVVVSQRINPAALDSFSQWLLEKLFPRHNVVAVVTNSMELEKALRSRLHSSGRVTTIPNPVDPGEIALRSAEPRNSPPAKGFILAVGRLEAQKGFMDLLVAFANSAARHHRPLVILGEGKERPALLERARNLGIAHDVLLPGALENPFPYYRDCGFFVLSSRLEGFPNALLEAMACGVSCIATDCPYGPREMLLDPSSEPAGLLVPVGDIQALQEAIDRLHEDVDLREVLASRARHRTTRYSLVQIAAQWIDLQGRYGQT